MQILLESCNGTAHTGRLRICLVLLQICGSLPEDTAPIILFIFQFRGERRWGKCLNCPCLLQPLVVHWPVKQASRGLVAGGDLGSAKCQQGRPSAMAAPPARSRPRAALAVRRIRTPPWPPPWPCLRPCVRSPPKPPPSAMAAPPP